MRHEHAVQEACLKLVDEMLLNSAHDCSDGGLAVAIAECCFSSLNNAPDGAAVELSSNGLDPETVLFSESPSRIVVSFDPRHLERVREIAHDLDAPFEVIGKVTGDDLTIAIDGKQAVSAPVAQLQGGWRKALEELLEA